MATYKGIKGFKVQTLAADPVALAAWSTGGAMNTGRNNAAGMGTVTAAVASGGASNPLGYTANTEHYNGTAWSEETNMPSATSYFGTAGSQTAGLMFGGTPGGSPQCFKYNGSAWTSSGALATGSKQGAGTGTQTAALFCGGETPSVTTITQEFDGSTWSSGGAMNQSRNNNSAFGTQTDAVTVGGAPSPGAQYNAEEYNGSAWTVGNPLIKGRADMGKPAAGTASTAGMVATGSGPPVPGESTAAEGYDGTSWSIKSATMTTARGGSYGTRSPVSSYLITGGTPGYKTSTEIYEENSEPNTFLNEGQMWYNSTGNALKFYNGTTVKTVTTS